MNERRADGLFAFFSHPAVGVAGTAASVVGLFLAIYFYLRTQQSPDVSVYEYPLRTTVIKAGEVSGLGVSMGGRPVTSDVTALQVAIWNAGRAPVRQQDILQPLRIRLSVPVLKVSVQNLSRPVTALRVNDAQKLKGELSFDWTVLEHNDGALVQLIYAGSPETPLTVSGVFIDQPKVTISNSRTALFEVKSPADIVSLRRSAWFIVLVGPLLPLVSALVMARSIGRSWGYMLRATWPVLTIFTAAFLIFGLFVLYTLEPLPTFVTR